MYIRLYYMYILQIYYINIRIVTRKNSQINKHGKCKPPEVLDPPSYYSLLTESTFESHANCWPKITRFKANQSNGISLLMCYVYVN